MKINKTLKFILIAIGIIAAVVGIMLLLFELAPWLSIVIAFPTWLIAALSSGGKV